MEQYTEPATGIEANDLLIFARVADLGSFSRAAERLGLPKSTVSRRVAWLESHLGERLLLRTTRRQTLTEFGSLLLEHARQVVTEVEAVTALREHRQAAPSGRLRVSMPSDFANLVLADRLAAFVALHPAISLELDLSPRRVDLLGEGFDIAVRMGALPDDALLAARRLTVFSDYTYTLETIIQAGQKNMAITSVPIRVNGDLRPSRLVKSIASYIQRSIVTIIRVFVIYRPFRFFASIGIALFTLGFIIGLRFLYKWLTMDYDGHIQSLILASSLLIIGFHTILIAFVADLLSANRKLMEEVRALTLENLDGGEH